jgi:putative SOS response-associated peptidase YedK
MCGRYSLHANPEVVSLLFGLSGVPAYQPRYNIAPTMPVLIVREDGAARVSVMVKWGLVPYWAKDPSMGARMNNARAESVAEKPSFRDAYRKRRCLIPASGFYEWQELEGKMRGSQAKQPWYIYPREGELFAFAGLWESWNGPGGPLETCAIITTEPNEVMAPIHERMPVIVAPADYGRWLAGGEGLLGPCPSSSIAAHPVSKTVNRAANDSPDLIVPLDTGYNASTE